MGRLIDADALIEFIDAGHLRHPSELCFSELDVVNMLNHAPIAYDVDAVVKQLEEARQFVDLSNPTSPISHKVSAIHPSIAIEIVRKGGV